MTGAVVVVLLALAVAGFAIVLGGILDWWEDGR